MLSVKEITKKSILFILVLSIFFGMSINLLAEEDSIDEVEEKLTFITDEEKSILESLFIQVQSIEELTRERDSITEEINSMKEEIEDLETLIENETINYEERLSILEQVLVSYQRMGPGSYIEIILNSDDISDFLQRINVIRDLTKNTGELLESIDESKYKLQEEKENMDNKLVELNQKEVELVNTIESEEMERDKLEAELAKLSDDRQYYQERLDSLILMMDEVNVLMESVMKEFSNIIEDAHLSQDSIEFNISKEGIVGRLSQDVFNSIVNENSNLPEIIFSFETDKVSIEFPENSLYLIGDFQVVDDHTIEFQVEEGRFYDMFLSQGSVEEFFDGGGLKLDLKSILGNNRIIDVKTFDGYISFTVAINLN